MQSAAGAIVATENLTRNFGRRRAVDGVTISVAARRSAGPLRTQRRRQDHAPPHARRNSAADLGEGAHRRCESSGRIRRARESASYRITRCSTMRLQLARTSSSLPGFTVFPGREAATERALSSMQIMDRADTPVRALSRGMRQRVSVARATCASARPGSRRRALHGLDVVGCQGAFRRLLTICGQTARRLVLVTHNVDEGLVTRDSCSDHGPRKNCSASMIAGR